MVRGVSRSNQPMGNDGGSHMKAEAHKIKSLPFPHFGAKVKAKHNYSLGSIGTTGKRVQKVFKSILG